jgi:hypothetical protein
MTALPGAQRLRPAAPLRSGMMPPPADCASARAGTGLSPDTLAAGTAVVLTSPAPPRDIAADWCRGTGKTQHAVYLAESLWHSRHLALLVWVDAATRSSILAGYAHAFAEILGTAPGEDAETAGSRFVAWLAEASQPWLVVFDDLTDAADLAGLWPQGPAGRVLVTARQGASLPGEFGAMAWPIGVFSGREALAYVLARLPSDPDQRVGAVDLIEDLGCHPLALAQATALIASSDLTCRDYIRYFAHRKGEISRLDGREPAPAAVTWTLSLEHADRLRPAGLAQPCLALAALLDCKGIPGSVFDTPAVREYVAASGSGNRSDPEPSAGLANLQRAGLLTIDPARAGPTVRLSALVKGAVTATMPDAVRDQAGTTAARALLEAWPTGDWPPPLAQALRSGAACLRRAAPDGLFSGECHPVLLRAGRSLDAARLTGAAVGYWRDIAATCGRLLGPSHADTLEACGMLSRALVAAGRLGEAIPLCEQVLGRQIGTYGPDHPGSVAAGTDLGRALLGFASIIINCTGLSLTSPLGSPCKNHYTAGGTDQLAQMIAAIGPKVAAALAAIHQRAPRARALLVGYPDILPDAGRGCWPVVPIAHGDVPYLRGAEAELNAMLADEAAANGATFVDTYRNSIGHDFCQRTGVKWVEGLVPTSPAAPVHPNALGERAMAQQVLAAVG